MDDFLKREIQRLDGLFYGSLSEGEREIVDEACKRGIARRDWSGPAGFFAGLSRVVVL